jgi:hypothetical protein
MKEFKIGQKVWVEGKIIKCSDWDVIWGGSSSYLVEFDTHSSEWFSKEQLEAATREPEPEPEGKEMRLIKSSPGLEIGKVYHVKDVKDLPIHFDVIGTTSYYPKSYFQSPDLPVRVRVERATWGTLWYSDKIGNEFNVVESFFVPFKGDWELSDSRNHVIYKSDCTVLGPAVPEPEAVESRDTKGDVC